MNQVAEAAEQMKKYIAEHLKETITARDVAKAAGYSQYHAARIFKEEIGLSPFEYIRKQRLKGKPPKTRINTGFIGTPTWVEQVIHP